MKLYFENKKQNNPKSLTEEISDEDKEYLSTLSIDDLLEEYYDLRRLNKEHGLNQEHIAAVVQEIKSRCSH